MKFDGIYFYNCYHNGDIHVSRGFVKQICKRYNVKYFYGHGCYPKIIDDLDMVKYDTTYNSTHKETFKSRQFEHYFIKDNLLFINTWYGLKNYYYVNNFGITFDSLYYIFQKTIKENNLFDLEDIEYADLFPDIDFSKFNIDNVDKYINTDNFKILICNGDTYSGQSNNQSMDRMIDVLSKKYNDVLFILSNKCGIKNNNIIESADIIRKNENDLNENGYISTMCNMVIGRVSGAHTFALNKTNLFDRFCDIISFSTFKQQDGNFWIGDSLKDKITYSSNVTNYQTINLDDMITTTSRLIDKRLSK